MHIFPNQFSLVLYGSKHCKACLTFMLRVLQQPAASTWKVCNPNDQCLLYVLYVVQVLLAKRCSHAFSAQSLCYQAASTHQHWHTSIVNEHDYAGDVKSK